MARRSILTLPHPILRKKSLEVHKFDSLLHDLLNDMRDTLYAADGVGLAAPQIGVNLRVVVIDVTRDQTDSLLELINPTIVEAQKSISSEEGCLSIPDYRDSISRRGWVKVRAMNRHGESFDVEGEGLMSRCLQHEIDHLDGILFVDHLSFLKKELFQRWLKKQDKDPVTGQLLRESIE
jgi:peptide deformylase